MCIGDFEGEFFQRPEEILIAARRGKLGSVFIVQRLPVNPLIRRERILTGDLLEEGIEGFAVTHLRKVADGDISLDQRKHRLRFLVDAERLGIQIHDVVPRRDRRDGVILGEQFTVFPKTAGETLLVVRRPDDQRAAVNFVITVHIGRC